MDCPCEKLEWDYEAAPFDPPIDPNCPYHVLPSREWFLKKAALQLGEAERILERGQLDVQTYYGYPDRLHGALSDILGGIRDNLSGLVGLLNDIAENNLPEEEIDASDESGAPTEEAGAAWVKAGPFLLSELSGDENAPVVCVEHRRFIPCRSCMYQEPAKVPYSDDPKMVESVKLFQTGKATHILNEPCTCANGIGCVLVPEEEW